MIDWLTKSSDALGMSGHAKLSEGQKVHFPVDTLIHQTITINIATSTKGAYISVTDNIVYISDMSGM